MSKNLARLIVGVGVVGTILGFLGGVHWSFDLWANFRPHLAVAGLVVAIIVRLLRHKTEAVAALLAALVNAGTVVPLYLDAPVPPTSATEQFTVLLSNVHRLGGDPAKLASAIRLMDADIIGLIEVNAEWLAALAPTLKAWPHHISRPQADDFGIALFSKTPLRGAKAIELGAIQVPVLVARTVVAGREVGLVLAHPPPPITGGMGDDRDAILHQIATLEGLPDERVVFGDFNATPWSAPFREMLAAGDLRSGRQGRGIQGTWPAALGVLGIPIDHILTGGLLTVVDHVVLPDIGSDHRPIAATIVALPK